MFIVQKFHSIHEIDPEFIQSIEVLLQEELVNFSSLVERHDTAPETDVFTYFLFFGPTQNSPIGFAQLCLRQIPSEKFRTFGQKMKFWDKSHLHWKQLTWQVGDGSHGLYVFDSRFARTGKEKLQELIKEYEDRSDVMAQCLYTLKGMQEFRLSWTPGPLWTKEFFVIEPLNKSFKTYEDYLKSLAPTVQKQIKASWKQLHKGVDIKLGDYANAKDTPNTIPVDEKMLASWIKLGAQVLTFEKDLKVLGCIVVLKGRGGNFFFEPFPFEPEGGALVNDDLYTQYALLKFFEMPEARKCHLMKNGSKLTFEEKADLQFFEDQGFHARTVVKTFCSRLLGLDRPV